MRSRALLFIAAVLVSAPAFAQATWQPSSPPLVTAQNESWYQAGSPIDWNGVLYYPAGAKLFFNGDHMVRSGSYRGIPLYTDTTLEPYSMVFVPVAGGLLQPYERPRTGPLAGTVGSEAPSLPTAVASEHPRMAGAPDNPIQAPGPPTYARAYDLSGLETEPTAVGTAGTFVTPGAPSSAPAPYRPGARVETAAKPTGINGSWIEFDGRMWVNAGRALDYVDGVFVQAGTVHGYPIYRMKGDDTTLYVPTIPGKVTPYRLR
jgi:hypothetical protein